MEERIREQQMTEGGIWAPGAMHYPLPVRMSAQGTYRFYFV